MPMIIGGDGDVWWWWWWWWWWQWRSARSLMTIVTNGRRKFRSQTSDNMGQIEKQRWRASEKRRWEGRRSDKRKSGKKEDAGARKNWKSRKTLFFPIFCGSGERKVGSLMWRERKHLGRWEMKNCTPWWREAYFEVKMYKGRHSRRTFVSWDVQKSARRRRCGEANFEAKMYKAHHSRSTFGSWDVPKNAGRCGASTLCTFSQKC